MPNFKKSDGFSLGGSPFTMKKGSKEITTDGSFRKEATDKMGGYGSPLFAIVGRDPRAAGAAYDDSSVSDMAEDVDNAQAESKAVKDGKKDNTKKKENDVEETTSDLEKSDNTPKVPKTAEAGDGEGGKDIIEKGKEGVKKIAGALGLGG